MNRAAQLKRWPGWVLLVLVVAGFLAFGTTRDAGARTPEERVEEISKQLACPICDGETVYESRNTASASIRATIKTQVTTTDATDDEIIAYIVQQFGYKTQLLPKSSGFESLVWVLPAVAMAGFFVAIFSRLTRAAMLEVRHQDFVRTATAKGLSPTAVTLRHVLRNALIPVTTVAGMHFGTLLGGAIVIESVFSWPGLGRLALESVLARDYNVLLGILLLSSLLVIVANMLVDLLHAWLDPRIQVR